MRYRIILYDRATDEAAGVVEVPRKHLARVLTLAGITGPAELGEIPLDEDQVREIARLIGFAADAPQFHYHLEPFAAAHARVSA